MSDDPQTPKAQTSEAQTPKAQPPAERSPQGGSKDTDNLAGIKGVQRTGMLEKGKQADQTPQSGLGTDVPKRPQQR